MKRLITSMATVGVIVGFVAFAALPSFAQQTPQTPSTDNGQTEAKRHETYRNRDALKAGKLDSRTKGANIRASQLIGMNIQNPQGKSVGEINDLVVDGSSGKIRYAAVTYGGFLGLGDKMFAVPFEAFQCQQHPDDQDEHILVLDITQSQLEGSEGFDQDSWPNFADPNFTNQIDKRYGVKRRGVDVDVNRKGVDVGVGGNNTPRN